MIIDTHSHPYLESFDSDRDEIISRAIDADVKHIIMPNVDLGTIERMREFHTTYPEITSMAMGLHPTEIKESWRDDIAMIDAEWDSHHDDYIAVGEIGIDLYWDKTFANEQMQAFEIQSRYAVEMNLPIIIHCREGLDQTLEVLSGFEKKPTCVFHSFGGTPKDVERIRNIGDFYFGINGVVTFKNAHLENTINQITLNRILLETDAPYLAPVPKRGKRNEPSYITYTRDKIAKILDVDNRKVDDITTISAKKIFGI